MITKELCPSGFNEGVEVADAVRKADQGGKLISPHLVAQRLQHDRPEPQVDIERDAFVKGKLPLFSAGH